jgi:hypothetical protein
MPTGWHGSPDEPEAGDPACMDFELTPVAYAYQPAGLTAKDAPAVAAGGAAVMVSPAALVAVQSLIVNDDGKLPMTPRTALARIDEREGHQTELSVLVRALARRDVFVR